MFHLNFGPKGTIMIDDAELIFNNFSGGPTKFNPKGGDRGFSVVIPDEEVYDALKAEGWNVIRRERPDGSVRMHLPVKVKFHEGEFEHLNPVIYLMTNGKRNVLKEDTVFVLDSIAMERVDLDISPSRWNVNGDSGVAAYLKKMAVVQEIDRFEERYAEEEYPEE